MSYQAALYLRLSRDDEGAGESASIVNQRKLLRAYAAEQGFSVFGEYVDDGWSGTSFDRPAWKRMIGDIEAGQVNLVLTKDLSRLGRDYIAAGQYTELYFPQKGVRYIAVGDGYDSASPWGDIAPFKNVVNELYARDTSRKIKAALRTKMQEGSFIGNAAPFGYRKDPENKNHLLPDPATAPVVRELFARAAAGTGPRAMADGLNERGVSTPGMYRDAAGSGPVHAGRWTASMICKLLKNRTYLGAVVQGKTEKPSFKRKTVRRRPPETWFVVEHMHEALVSQALFDAAASRVVPRKRQEPGGFRNLFSGLAFCADCGCPMSSAGSRKRGYRLICGAYKRDGTAACASHSISYSGLCEAVLSELQQALEGAVPAGGPAAATHSGRGTGQDVSDEMLLALYRDRAAGRLDEARFQRLLAAAKTQGMDTDGFLAEQTTPPEQSAARPEYLTEALLRGLIARIEVCQGARGTEEGQLVRIFYRFSLPGQP